MSVRTHATWALVGALVLLPRVAATQAVDSTPRVSVGAGAGFGIPFHGDFDFTPWAWDADVRVAMSPHVLFEAAIGSAQGVGGAEVRLVEGLGVYGQLRFVVPFTDPGGSDLRVTTGLRWSFGR